MNESQTPVFVKIEEYKDVLDVINVIKAKIKEANSILDKVTELKSKEDSELDGWRTQLEEVERKFSFIDKAMFEPESTGG